MTENEIIKALENYSLKTHALFEAINLIKHQREEIDALRWTNKQLIKAEKEKRRELWEKAITEFEDRLIDRADLIRVNSFDSKWAISQDDIDNIVEEMISHIKE